MVGAGAPVRRLVAALTPAFRGQGRGRLSTAARVSPAGPRPALLQEGVLR